MYGVRPWIQKKKVRVVFVVCVSAGIIHQTSTTLRDVIQLFLFSARSAIIFFQKGATTLLACSYVSLLYTL